MLANRVNDIPAVMLDTPNGGQMPLPMACHQATAYWLYEEAFDEAPTGDHFLNSSLGNVSQMMTNLARQGKVLSPPRRGNLELTRGTVLVFKDRHGEAAHSCVMQDDETIGGFNQVNWFTSEGVSHGFSTHNTSDIKWRSRLRTHKVKLNTEASNGNLVAVEELRAVDFFRFNFVYPV